MHVFFKYSNPRVLKRNFGVVSNACSYDPLSHPTSSVMEEWLCTLESQLRLSLAVRVEQGELCRDNIFRVRLTVSFRLPSFTVVWLRKTSQAQPALSSASRITLPLGSPHYHAESVLVFTAYSLLRFNLSSSSPLLCICFPLCAVLL